VWIDGRKSRGRRRSTSRCDFRSLHHDAPISLRAAHRRTAVLQPSRRGAALYPLDPAARDAARAFSAVVTPLLTRAAEAWLRRDYPRRAVGIGVARRPGAARARIVDAVLSSWCRALNRLSSAEGDDALPQTHGAFGETILFLLSAQRQYACVLAARRAVLIGWRCGDHRQHSSNRSPADLPDRRCLIDAPPRYSAYHPAERTMCRGHFLGL
jgi:hypothetical protein